MKGKDPQEAVIFKTKTQSLTLKKRCYRSIKSNQGKVLASSLKSVLITISVEVLLEDIISNISKRAWITSYCIQQMKPGQRSNKWL